MSALVKIIKNPFDSNILEDTFKVEKICVKEIKGVDDNSVIYVNGNHVDKDYVLKNGDVCVVRQYPSAATLVTLAIGAEIFSLATTGKTIGGNALDVIKKQFQPDVSNIDNKSREGIEQLPSVSGSKNTSALGKAIPLILGKTLFTPYILGQPYNTIAGADGCDQYYNCLYLIGYKDLKIEDVSLGIEVLATNSNNVESGALTITSDKFPVSTNNTQLELEQGASTQASSGRTDGEVGLYPTKVIQENRSDELLNVEGTGTPFYYFSARYAKKVEIEFTLAGLVSYDSKGNKQDAEAKVKVEYSLDGETWYNCSSLIDFTNKTGNSYYDSTNQVIVFKHQATKTLRYVLRQTMTKQQMDSSLAQTVQYRVTRMNAQSTDTNTVDKVYVSAIRTWCYDYTKSKTAQELVDQAPMNTKERNKTARLGFRIKVTEAVQTYFDKLTVIATSKARTWNGTGWSKTLTPTRNPAALALHSMIGDYRDQYAYKYTEGEDYIDCPKINLDDFGACYEECDTDKNFGTDPSTGEDVIMKKYLCDGAVVNSTKSIDLVNSILQCARSNLVLKGKKYGIYMDRPQDYPLLVLNNNNLLSLNYTKSFDEIPDGQYVKYISSINYYQQDTLTVKPNGAPALSDDDKMQNVTYPYITDPYHAKAMSLYQQACIKLRPETFQAKVTNEGGLAEVGSLVDIQSDVVLIGIGDGAEITGLVESNNTITGIETDGRFAVTDITKHYGVVINVVDSSGNEKAIRRKLADFTETGTYSDLTFDEPISTSAIAKPEVGCLVSFGFYENETMSNLCIGKDEKGDGTFVLTLTPYDEQIYSADSIIVHDFDPKTTSPKDSGAPIDYGDKSKPVNQLDVLNIVENTRDLTPPPVPSAVSAKAFRDYIELKWAETTHGNVKETVIELSKDGDETTENSWVEVERRKTNTWNYYFDRNSNADGYPEADDLTEYRFRLKNVSPNNIESSYCNSVTPNVTGYGTWIMPETINVQKEVIDRTVILTALYEQPEDSGGNPIELYGTVKTRVWISRKGNTDEIGNETFNDYLDITPDDDNGTDLWYTPEFNENVMPSNTANTENNYCHYSNGAKTTDAHISNTYKISQTLPLIGQTKRLFDSDGEYIGHFNFEAHDVSAIPDVTEEPSSPSVGDYIHYTGTTDDLEEGKYYIYTDEEEWEELPLGYLIHYTGTSDTTYENGKYYRLSEKTVSSETVEYFDELIAKMVMVPTNYKYKIQLFIEESQSESDAVELTAQALCTNISDIVHSHEHYKDLYVEKLSAINANIGMISQGGMGTFDRNNGNYWALSNLTAEDSGVAGGVFQGEFRVGGADQYFRVSVDPTDHSKYNIELKAGNISLTSSTEGQEGGMSFKSGTYIYDSAASSKRLWLTPTGMIAQRYINTAPSGQTPVMKWVDVAQIRLDANGNLIITNSKSVPDFGFQDADGIIYHFDDENNLDDEEVTTGTPTNPMSIDVTGCTAKENDDSALLDIKSSRYSAEGTVTKDISQFSDRVVFFSKADKVISGSVFLPTLEEHLIADEYNDLMTQAKGSSTVGAYLNLTSTQIANRIFTDY